MGDKMQVESTDQLVDPELARRLAVYRLGIRVSSLAAVLFLTVGGIVAYWGIPRFKFTPEGLDQLGGFLSGATGVLWSAAGLFLISAAFVGQLRQSAYQEEDIRLNRLELRQTQAELRGQKEQLAEQNRTFQQQRFESTFFQLLGLHHQIVNNVDRVEKQFRFGKSTYLGNAEPPVEEFHGRDVFVRIYHDLSQAYQRGVESRGPMDLDVVLNEVYEGVYQRNQSDVGHYFRNLYTLIKFVNASEIVDKRQYTNIVRAQLSTHELLLLFYNALSKYGVQKFKPLIEDYGLLKNMPEGMLLEKEHRNAYRTEAFGLVGPAAESLPS